jgi:hypothetical protein
VIELRSQLAITGHEFALMPLVGLRGPKALGVKLESVAGELVAYTLLPTHRPYWQREESPQKGLSWLWLGTTKDNAASKSTFDAQVLSNIGYIPSVELNYMPWLIYTVAVGGHVIIGIGVRSRVVPSNVTVTFTKSVFDV